MHAQQHAHTTPCGHTQTHTTATPTTRHAHPYACKQKRTHSQAALAMLAPRLFGTAMDVHKLMLAPQSAAATAAAGAAAAAAAAAASQQ